MPAGDKKHVTFLIRPYIMTIFTNNSNFKYTTALTGKFIVFVQKLRT